MRHKSLFTNSWCIRSFCILLLIAAQAISGSTLLGQASLPVDPGEVVATCFSDYEANCPGPINIRNPVLVLFDTRDPVGQGAVLDVNWSPPIFHNEPVGNPHFWSAEHLGQIYGVALDSEDNPNIYVTATKAFGDWPDDQAGSFGPGGPGGVYKIDGTSGDICVLTMLPQPALAPGQARATGLGTLTSMTTSTGTGFVFVSNLDDGLIYRVPTADCGVNPNTLSTFDHGVTALPLGGSAAIPDDVGVRFTQLNRRVYGLGFNSGDDRLYYAIVGTSEVWSVGIDPATGAFQPATAQLEFTKPPLQPTTAITFSPSGHMFLAERTISANSTGNLHNCSNGPAHNSRVLEYQLVAGTWTPEPVTKYEVGAFSNQRNAAGGVAVDCEDNVWATADAIHFGGSTGHPDTIYGMLRMPAGGNDGQFTSTSYVIDFGGPFKTEIGQLAMNPGPCETCRFTPDQVLCEIEREQVTGNYILTGTFKNLQDIPGTHLLLPPNAISPPGVQLCFGDGSQVLPLDPPLGNGDCFEIGSTPDNSIIIKNAEEGDEVCFRMVLLGENGEECCVVEVCVVMPPCDCLQVDTSLDRWEVRSCEPLVITYTFQLTNLFGQDVYHAFLASSTPGVTLSPDYFDLVALNGGSPLGHGQSVFLTTTITGAEIGDLLEFLITIHNEDLSECCTRPHAVVIPDLCNEVDFRVVSGNHTNGGMEEIGESDNSDVTVQRSNLTVASIVDVEVTSYSQTLNPSSISFVVEGSVFARRGVSQTLSAFNFQTNSFEVLDSRDASRFLDQTVSVHPAGDLARFVNPVSGEVVSRVRFDGENRRLKFSANIDTVNVITTE